MNIRFQVGFVEYIFIYIEYNINKLYYHIYCYYIVGGSFPLPTAAAQLCTILPPPGCFRGPFVVVDLLMDVFSRIQLPDHGIYYHICKFLSLNVITHFNN